MFHLSVNVLNDAEPMGQRTACGDPQMPVPPLPIFSHPCRFLAALRLSQQEPQCHLLPAYWVYSHEEDIEPWESVLLPRQ